MNTRIPALSVLALLTANAANAAVFFNTIDPPAGPSTGFDGPQSDSVPVMASSFFAPTPNFSQLSLTLAADHPNDGGSFSVLLVPDDGSGSASGVAGAPTYSGGTTFSSYTNAVLLGTVADFSLAAAGVGSTRVALNVSPATNAALAAQTANSEYWVALLPSANSSVDWLYNAGDAGIGTAGQAYFNTVGGLQTSADTSGAYQMLVDTPEPGTLAVLAVGLAGIGYARRRAARQL